MVKMDLNTLPEEERIVYHTLNKLNRSEKRVLLKLIDGADKNQICEYPQVSREIRKLESVDLITLNYDYEGSQYSFFVMPKAPQLLKKLKRPSNRKAVFGMWGLISSFSKSV
ncbi:MULTISPECIES: hypothetical protein [Bacillaceae]|uniref:Uncharacterized protein n=1 Tax=Evansella alkalicola TaxID=745819 RepID=A0ABS6JX80_9BACI|nr:MULTISPECIES: hypothetical protein [Bacillaceae]MBU9723197.1 hypothetical protein [Bacillus alkalicola]